jgi:hypothetical protein
MSADFPDYTQGYIAMLNGDLLDVTNVKITTKRNNKIIHTLRRSGAGKQHGTEETTVTFDAVVSEAGPERDYLADLKAGKIRKLRYKMPGETGTVLGSADERSVEFSLDNAVKYSISFSGRLDV